METRNIFIDASIFIGKNYNYRNTDFEQLSRLAQSNQANVFVTDITIREVKAHIKTGISTAISALKKFQKDTKVRVLKNFDDSPVKELFQEIDETKSTETLKCQLSTFLNEINATVLPTSEVSIDAVFDKYFGKRPPFGEGKKKSEFPDAFAIGAIEVWCKKNDERMYIVSSDGDLKEYCKTSDRLIALNKLAEFINVIESHDEDLAHAVSALLNKNHDAIKEAITESFYNQSFWIEDQDGDVNEVRVKELEISEMLILEVTQDSAFVLVDVETTFSADVTYDDLETATYDSEDKILIPLRTIDKIVDRDVKYVAALRILHDVKHSEYFIVNRVELQSDQASGFDSYVDFAIHIDNEWPYK